MPKPTTKPPLYRLTVTAAALNAFSCGAHDRGFRVVFHFPIERQDGRWDVGISFGLLDQLKTAALPKENLSDTLLRLYPPAAPAA